MARRKNVQEVVVSSETNEVVENQETLVLSGEMVEVEIKAPEVEEAPEVEDDFPEPPKVEMPSILSQVAALNSAPVEEKKSTKRVKNENVWGNVKLLFDAGKTNKEALAEIHEMYGNTQTSYACIAWYRNKYNKLGDQGLSLEAKVNNFLCQFGASEEQVKQLLALIK